MFGLPPLMSAVLTGFLSGLLASVPVGPVNLTIINEGTRRGFAWAGLIALGSMAMDLFYCALALTGFASFFEKGVIKAAMEVFSFGFMLYLGTQFLLASRVPANPPIEARLEARLHPRSAFWIGFVRVLGNPAVLLFWIVLAANFISRRWVLPNWPGKLSYLSGVALGSGLWFLGLCWAVSIGHKRFSEKTLLRMEHISGLCLLGLALAHGLQIMWQLARHRM